MNVRVCVDSFDTCSSRDQVAVVGIGISSVYPKLDFGPRFASLLVARLPRDVMNGHKI